VKGRACGACSLCCTLLRVDALGKLGGTPCVHQRPGRPEGACAIHAERPRICRAYRCLWLEGGLEEADRPDRLGAVLSLAARGETPTLHVHEARPGAVDESPRLQEIVERFREALPVRVCDVGDVHDPERPVRVLLSGGVEHRLLGDAVEVRRPGAPPERRRLPWADRALRRAALAWRRLHLRLVRRRGR
jgi:hypothetical protein